MSYLIRIWLKRFWKYTEICSHSAEDTWANDDFIQKIDDNVGDLPLTQNSDPNVNWKIVSPRLRIAESS